MTAKRKTISLGQALREIRLYRDNNPLVVGVVERWIKAIERYVDRRRRTTKVVEISPRFTDWARAAIAWVLWHHQGGSSAIGQPLRFALGIGAHEQLPAWLINDAKRWAVQARATSADFHSECTRQPWTDAEKEHLKAAAELVAERERMTRDAKPVGNFNPDIPDQERLLRDARNASRTHPSEDAREISNEMVLRACRASLDWPHPLTHFEARKVLEAAMAQESA